MDQLESKIHFIYRVNDFKFFTFSDLYESYGFNIFIVFCFFAYIMYLYVKIELRIYRKNWRSLKCHPKYLYVSGFIQKEGNLGVIDSTFYNYNDCIQQGISDAIDEITTESAYHTNNQKERIHRKNRDIIDKYNVHKSNLNNVKNNLDIPEDIIDKLDLTIDSNTASYYSQLQKIGVYVDQIDATFAYFYEYIKNYLSYLFFNYKKTAQQLPDGDTDKDENEEKANKVLKILNDHFDGINF